VAGVDDVVVVEDEHDVVFERVEIVDERRQGWVDGTW